MPYYGSAARARMQRRRIAIAVLLIAVIALLCTLGARFVSSLNLTLPAPVSSPTRISQTLPTAQVSTSTRSVTPQPTSAVTGESVFRAVYDANGQLKGLTDPSGKQTTDSTVLKTIPTQLNGGYTAVSLDQVAGDVAQCTDLQGAVYDTESKGLVLVCTAISGKPPLNPDDMVVAFQTVFAGRDPGVSIDPGPNRGEMVTRFIGKVADTHLGMVMFEADRLMKNLSLGKDNITGQPVTSKAPGHRTELDWSLQFFDANRIGQETWHRFWFVVDKMDVRASSDGRQVAFQTVKLKVNSECVDSNLKPLRDCNNASAIAFADQLTRNYDTYASEYPVLQELVQAAKWVSIAKWVQESNFPINLVQLSTGIAQVKTPATTPAITVSTEKQLCPDDFLVRRR
jgi:hypothetical protein